MKCGRNADSFLPPFGRSSASFREVADGISPFRLQRGRHLANNRHVAWTIVGVAVAMFGLAVARHVAPRTIDAWITYLTFSKSVRLPGVTLNAGTYIFELVD